MVRQLALLLLLAGPVSTGPGFAAPEAPRRVVSINLCTDQLAILLAAPGQLISVSDLAQDPRSSTMVEAAMAYPANQGQAEEVYLMKPDLVLAGAYTARATVSMLERLGIRVVTFPPASSIAEVRQGMIEMGRALGREAAAQAMLEAFDARLARLPPAPSQRPTAATFAANGYASGSRSLAGEIIERAGYHHLAEDLGMPMGGFLPLEALIMADPDLVIAGDPYPGASRAEEVLHHPALAALTGGQTVLEENDWVCGLPALLDATERLAATRKGVGP
jgi:iron complex transport system substrate-binding protein